MRQVMPHRSNIVVRHLRCKSLLHKKAGHFLIAAAKGRGARGAPPIRRAVERPRFEFRCKSRNLCAFP
jgi:hypothetical protein